MAESRTTDAPGSRGATEEQELDSLVSAVLLASRALVGIAATSLAAAPADVTLVQYRLLVLLVSHGPQTPSALADELAVAPSSITRLCDRLVAKGLIARQVPETDRRQVMLSISPSGQALVDAVTDTRRREIRRVVGAIPPARRQRVVEVLNELSTAAGELPEHSYRLAWEP